MKKQLVKFFVLSLISLSSLHALDFELNTSYDHYRGLPDGSWNGNNGAVLSGNLGMPFGEGLEAQMGGSIGLYNWDGRENLVFKNPKKVQQQAFLTTGLFGTMGEFNAGIVYDQQFIKHFGIYDVRTSVNQLRFQVGYQFCNEEIGIWGTTSLTTSHKTALGVPLSFKAIGQLNFFWTHSFDHFATTTVWMGAPYAESLRYHNKAAGVFTGGFSIRAPLTPRLFIDAHGAYMAAQKSSGNRQTYNYSSNICVGITYLLGECPSSHVTYMPIGNNSNFLVDTNINQ